MTPAINVLKAAKVYHQVHEYVHDDSAQSYGSEAAEKMGVDASRVFKTLLVKLDNAKLAVGIVDVASQLSMKQIAKAAGAKKAVMAEKSEAERSTGYVLGGVSPLGQKKRLPTIIDASIQNFETIFVSAGRRGLEIELKPSDLVQLSNAVLAELSQ